VRYSAADILNKLGQAQMQDAPLVTDTDGARQKRQAVAGILISMLGDRDRDFRLAAAEALGRLGVPDAVSLLVEHLTDSDPAVQVASARSLESLRWEPNRMGDKARQLVALERWADVVGLGEHAVEALADASNGRSVVARRRAIETLVKIGGVKAISALNRIAAEPDGAVREEALAGISVLKTDSPLIVHVEAEPQSTGPII